jgi:hypothetical protein
LIVEGALMVKVTDAPLPDEGTLPEPDQPVHAYWTPEPPETGEVTDSVTTEPEANQPLAGEGVS